MSIKQYCRAIWARKWLALLLLMLVSTGGIVYVSKMPKWYVAGSTLVVDVRPDPILGGLATPANMATQVEILKSDKVATRAVSILGMDHFPAAVQQWREATGGKVPLDRYFADILQHGLTAEPLRGSNVINITFGSRDAAFAAAAANAFAQGAMDVAVEMRVEPARQSATWFDGQTKALRVALEQAQERLSKYQQETGIVVSDERLDLENARLSALTAQLAVAQAESVEASGRQRVSG